MRNLRCLKTIFMYIRVDFRELYFGNCIAFSI